MKFRLPANVDMPDRIFAGLTVRQLAILASDGLLVWLLYLAVGRTMHPALFASVALPLAAAGVVLVAPTPEGIGFDQLAVLAARFLLKPRRRVLAPDGISAVLRTAGPIASIDVPIYDIAGEDLIDLGSEGFACLSRASGVNLSLRSDTEQASLIETFARFLNSLDGSTQFLVASRRVDLGGLVSDLTERASSLAHPALEKAARQHIRYLEELVGRRDVRRRELLVCFREPSTSHEDASVRLSRRIDQAQNLLRGLGVSLRRVPAEEAGRYLRACGDPEGRQPPAATDLSLSTITGVAT